ncbi:MAG: CHAT domain-containing protein [Chloroflexi bacterium]|nr:CHAT domain-containing protein [Chloroflexota bacterium]
MNYINFDIRIEPKTNEGYPVLADSTKYGQERAMCQLDVSGAEMAAKLEAVANDEIEGDELTAFGRLLAANLLTGQVEDLFNKIVGAVQSQPKNGVRIRLRINAPELNVLPWEFLQTEAAVDPLGISARTVVTRYIEMNELVREVEAPQPLRMLGIIPQGSGLNVESEKAALEKAVSELGDELKVTWLEGIVTRDRIRGTLGEAEYHLVHFIGHGHMDSKKASLLLNDDGGDDYPILAESFAGFFRDSSVRLVVLNACRGAARSSADAMVGVAPQAVRIGVPAVVAMQWDIGDRVAQQFAKSFYRSLCIGPEAGEVDTAVTKGRAVLYDDWRGTKAFATPVLFLRAEDGRLWKGGEKEDDEDTKTAPVQQTTVQNIGVQISGSTIAGDVTGGSNIKAGGNVIIAGEGANVNIGAPTPAGAPGSATALAALMAQTNLWQNAINTKIESSGLSTDEKKDLKDTTMKIKAEMVKNQNLDPGRLAKLINTLGMMGSNDLVDLTVKRLAPPLSGVGFTLTMSATFQVTVDRAG